MELPPCQWPKVGLMAPKYLIKESLNTLYILLCFLIAVFDKEANVRCSIGSISRPISWHNHKAINQAIATVKYQSYFKNLDNFISGKQQGTVRTDQKFIFFLSTIFVAASLSILSTTWPSLVQQRKQMKTINSIILKT